jgi:hypothetical protein
VKKPTTIQMTDAERAAAEKEKAELLVRITPVKKPAIEIALVGAAPTLTAPEAKKPALTPTPPAPEPPAQIIFADGPTVADLEAQLRETEAALADARRREKERAQAQIVQQQQSAQRKAAEQFAPMMGRLEHHLREIDRIQRTFGPTLRDYARSCASGDLPTRTKLGAIYGAAGPLGQRFGDARRTLEAAIRGVRLASDSPREHEHAQARTLADAALAINLIELEREAQILVNAKEEVHGPRAISSVTPDHLAPIREPSGLSDTADLGRSII